MEDRFKIGDFVIALDTHHLLEAGDTYIVKEHEWFGGDEFIGVVGIMTENYAPYVATRFALAGDYLESQFKGQDWTGDTLLETPNLDNDLAPQTDGGSATYYEQDIPSRLLAKWNRTGKIEVRDVARIFLDNDFSKVNIFKALVRLGKKRGVSFEYDINKSHFFLDDIREDLTEF